MNLIPHSQAHYYEHFNGTFKPCHQVPKKDGSGMRNTNRTDAVRMRLFPSVSQVNGVVAEPGLNNWKLTQAILAAITLPRAREDLDTWRDRCLSDLGMSASNEMIVIRWCYENVPQSQLTDDEFAARVVEDMEAQAKSAARLGAEIHDELRDSLKDEIGGWHSEWRSHKFDISAEAKRLSEPAIEWLTQNVTRVNATEQTVGSLGHGYAGTLDLDCVLKDIGPAVVDYKTATVKRNGNGPKPVFRNSWGKQLAAYAMAGEEPRTRALVSVIIDKGNRGEVFVKRWPNPGELWQQFLHSAAIWRFENDYDPRRKEQE